MKARSAILIILFLHALQGAWLTAADVSNTNVFRTGPRNVQFSESAPYSSEAEIKRRVGDWLGTPKYIITGERFRTIVPEGYSTNSDWGLFVWISPGDDAYIPPDWAPELAKQRLVFVSAYKSGNHRHPIDRVRLALDATCNMSRKYKIDAKRIYIGGFSGGGRIASILGVAYSDLFTGTFCICGVNFYRDVPTGRGNAYPATYGPDPGLVTRAKKNSRYVLLTGEHDPNRDNTKVTMERGFKADGFKNVVYTEVPGMDHVIPGAGELKKALEYLSGTGE